MQSFFYVMQSIYSKFEFKINLLNERNIIVVFHLIWEQAGTVLSQAQLKLELELTSFKICCLKIDYTI